MSSRKLGRVIMIRHGESIWNTTDVNRGMKTRFTGWSNIPLSDRGRAQALAAGLCLMQFGLHTFDAVYMSLLDRTTTTYDIIQDEIEKRKNGRGAGFKHPKIVQSWRLNERHYGALVGLSKDEAEQSMGHELVKGWRRSWDKCPPPMKEPFPSFQTKPEDIAWQRELWTSPLTIEISPGQSPVKIIEEGAVLPLSESLKDCAERVLPLWKESIVPRVLAGETVLIVAHSNTIRGMVRHIDHETLSDENLRHVTIPSAIPLIYSFDPCGERGVRPRGKLSPLGVRGRFVVNKEVLLLSLEASQHLEMSENLDDTDAFKQLLQRTLEKLSAHARVSQMSFSSMDERSKEEESRFVMEPGWMSFPLIENPTANTLLAQNVITKSTSSCTPQS